MWWINSPFETSTNHHGWLHYGLWPTVPRRVHGSDARCRVTEFVHKTSPRRHHKSSPAHEAGCPPPLEQKVWNEATDMANKLQLERSKSLRTKFQLHERYYGWKKGGRICSYGVGFGYPEDGSDVGRTERWWALLVHGVLLTRFVLVSDEKRGRKENTNIRTTPRSRRCHDMPRNRWVGISSSIWDAWGTEDNNIEYGTTLSGAEGYAGALFEAYVIRLLQAEGKFTLRCLTDETQNNELVVPRLRERPVIVHGNNLSKRSRWLPFELVCVTDGRMGAQTPRLLLPLTTNFLNFDCFYDAEESRNVWPLHQTTSIAPPIDALKNFGAMNAIK